MQIEGSHGIPIADQGAPPRPPEPQRDTLGGLMTATVAPAVQPYRERLLDILYVVDRTQIGRELLYDIRTLAGRGHHPFVDLAPPRDMPTREASKPHGLFLSEATLTAPASEIGLAPEVEHAPSVVLRLVQIRNALAARAQGNHARPVRIEPIDVPMDPIATVVAFRKELQALGALGPKPGIADAAGSAAAVPRLPMRPIEAHAPLTAVTDGCEARAVSLLCIPSGKDAGDVHPYEAVTEPGANGQTAAAEPTARRVFRWTEQKVQAFRNFVLRRRDGAGGDAHPKPPGPATPDKLPLQCVADVPGQAASAVHESPEPAVGTPERPIIKGTGRPSFLRHQRSPSGRWPKQGEEWK